MAMLLVVVVLASVVVSQSAPPLPPIPDFGSNYIHKNMIDNSFRSKNSVFKPPRCSVEELDSSSIGIPELQTIVERLAKRSDVSPFMVLLKLFERMRNRKDAGEFLNTLEGSELQQLLQSKQDLKSTISQLPPPPSVIPYEVSTGNHNPKGPFLIIPHHIDSNSDDGRPTMTEFVPLMLPFGRPFIPPDTAATVHVSSLPDVPVTVSPYMTVAEALQQANAKYRAVPGITANIRFARSIVHGVECVIIKNILGVLDGHNYLWKVEITNRDGQVIYHDICLPDGKAVRVKPGSEITVSYVSI